MDNTIPQDVSPYKHCRTCGQDFPATPEFFTSDKSKKDGFSTKCRQCRKQYRDEHREENRLKSLQYANEHREEKREYDRRYAREHREERTAYNKQYILDNKEKVVERRKAYYQRHREQRLEYNRTYLRNNRESYYARKKRYAAAHKDRINELAAPRRQKAEHKEYVRNYNRSYRTSERGRGILKAHIHNYRARKKATPGTLSPAQIQQKLKTQHYRCYYAACGFAKFEKKNGRYVYHLEHTIPLSRPEATPRHDVNYVVLSCPSCNLRKHNKLPHEFWEGGRLF